MIEALIEIVAEIVLNLSFEWLFGNLPAPKWNSGVAWAMLMAVVGGVLGWASTGLLPTSLIPWFAVRGVYIIVVPVAVAYLLSAWSRRRVAHGGRPGMLGEWSAAYCFALAFSVVRLIATL